MAPLLYRRLSDLGILGAVPPDCVQTLHDAFLLTAAENRRLFHWLRTALVTLCAAHIPTIALKGAHLAALIYDHPGLRPMMDLDVLVPEGDLERLEPLLASAGVRRLPDTYDVEQPVRHVGYLTPGGALLEFHAHLVSPGSPARFDPAALWAAARPAEINGAATCVLSPEHLLMHLCVHMFSHRAMWSLKGICDIGETVRHCAIELDWEAVVRDSTAWGLERCVYVALSVARQLLSVPVPTEALVRMCPGDLPAHAESTVIAGLADPDDTWRFDPIVRLWSEQPFAQKMRALLQAMFAPRRQLAYTYQVAAYSPRILLCYPLRWASRLVKAAPLVWAGLRSDPAARRQMAQQNRWRQLREYLFRLS